MSMLSTSFTPSIGSDTSKYYHCVLWCDDSTVSCPSNWIKSTHSDCIPRRSTYYVSLPKQQTYSNWMECLFASFTYVKWIERVWVRRRRICVQLSTKHNHLIRRSDHCRVKKSGTWRSSSRNTRPRIRACMMSDFHREIVLGNLYLPTLKFAMELSGMLLDAFWGAETPNPPNITIRFDCVE